MDWKKIIDFLTEAATSLGLKLLFAALALVVGIFLIRWVKKFLRDSKKLSKMDVGLRSFLASFSTIALYILLFITIAMILGVPTTSFITALASCGVAIGLALQGALSNVAGGIMLLIFKPFKIGDFIEAAGESGTVTDISVVYTVLNTVDNKRVTIPNGTLMNSNIENYSAEETRRVDLTFSTAYGCDISKTTALLSSIAADHPLALQDPAPFVRLTRHGENALEYSVRIWCRSGDYWTIYFDVIEQVKKAFDENGIEIPFPQVDVHVKEK